MTCVSAIDREIPLGPKPMRNDKFLSFLFCQNRLPQMISEVSRPAQEDGEAIAMRLFLEILLGDGCVFLEPFGRRQFGVGRPERLIDLVPHPFKVFCFERIRRRAIGILDEGRIEAGDGKDSKVERKWGG